MIKAGYRYSILLDRKEGSKNMKTIGDTDKMNGGVFIFTFKNANEASSFALRFQDCPEWPIIRKGQSDNELFVLSITLKKYDNVNCSDDSDHALVKNPDYIGAQKVTYTSINSVKNLLPKHVIEHSYAAEPPCGSKCEKCVAYKNKKCEGCPAVYDIL